MNMTPLQQLILTCIMMPVCFMLGRWFAQRHPEQAIRFKELVDEFFYRCYEFFHREK